MTRSVLLEIAKKESPELQRELMQKALKGTVTVRALRERTEPTPPTPVHIDSAPKTLYTYRLAGKGVVKIQMETSAETCDILSLLRELIAKLEGNQDSEEALADLASRKKGKRP